MEHIMDGATKAKLKGLLPFSETSSISVIPEPYRKLDIEEKWKPVFRMRGLTRSEHMDIVQATQRAIDGDSAKVTEIQLAVLRMIVVGWENLYDGSTGNEIKFTTDKDGGASEAVFYSLHYSVHVDMIGKMFEISGLAQLEKTGLKS